MTAIINSETEIASQISYKEPKKGSVRGFFNRRNEVIRKEKPPRSTYVCKTRGCARPRAPRRSRFEAGKDFPLSPCDSSEKSESGAPGNFYTTGGFQSVFCNEYKTL